MTEQIEKQLSKKEAQIRVFALTILGAGLSSALSIPAYEAVINVLSLGGTGQPLLPFFILSIIVPFFYCWGASLSCDPKRIVNPLNVQLLTVGIVTIFVLLVNAHQYSNDQAISTFFATFTATLAITLLFLGAFGLVQMLIVRWLVGLIGTTDDLDRKTYLINADFQTIQKILLSESVSENWNLVRKAASERKVEFYRPALSGWQVNLVLAPAQDANLSILATVAYQKNFYTISKSSKVSDFRDDLIRRIESVIGKKNLNPMESADEISNIALKAALKVTEPKTFTIRTALKEMDRLYILILALMGIITCIIVGLFAFQKISLDLFLTALVMILIALVIELAPKLREITDSRRSIKMR